MCIAGFFVVIIFFLIKMTDVVNVGNNSYHIYEINTSLRGSLLSCRVWVGIMVVFQVDRLFKQLGWNMLWSWRPFCTAREPLNRLATENESSLVLSPQPSVLQEVKGKTYRPKPEIFVFCLFFCYGFLKHCLDTAHKVWGFCFCFFNFLKTFFFLKTSGHMTKMLAFPFMCCTFSLLRRAGLLSLITVFLNGFKTLCFSNTDCNGSWSPLLM